MLLSEPRRPVLLARVSTRLLESAVQRLPSKRYPARLAVIDRELARRVATVQEKRAA